MYSYPIDYNEFTTEEITIIVEFLAMIEDANETTVDATILLHKFNAYKKVINSVSLMKQIDRDFEKTSGYSIYKTIQKYK